MHALTPPSAYDHNVPKHVQQVARSAHRLLVVGDGCSELAYGKRVAQSLSRHIPEADIQHMSIDALVANASRPPGEEALAFSSALPILNKFHLILVTTEHLRQQLSTAAPSLSQRIFRLDHFDNSSTAESRQQEASSSGESTSSSCDAWVRHWSICISQLTGVRSSLR